MRDPIIHPDAPLITTTKRKRSIWVRNSERIVDRYTQRGLAEMAAWEDPDDGMTESVVLPAIVVSAIVLGVVGVAAWFWWS